MILSPYTRSGEERGRGGSFRALDSGADLLWPLALCYNWGLLAPCLILFSNLLSSPRSITELLSASAFRKILSFMNAHPRAALVWFHLALFFHPRCFPLFDLIWNFVSCRIYSSRVPQYITSAHWGSRSWTFEFGKLCKIQIGNKLTISPPWRLACSYGWRNGVQDLSILTWFLLKIYLKIFSLIYSLDGVLMAGLFFSVFY